MFIDEIRMTVTEKHKILIQDDWSDFTFWLKNEILYLYWQFISNCEKEITIKKYLRKFSKCEEVDVTHTFTVFQSHSLPSNSTFALYPLLFVQVIED